MYMHLCLHILKCTTCIAVDHGSHKRMWKMLELEWFFHVLETESGASEQILFLTTDLYRWPIFLYFTHIFLLKVKCTNY